VIISCVTHYYAVELRVGLCGWGRVQTTQLLGHIQRQLQFVRKVCCVLVSRDYSLHYKVQTGCGAHPASYPKGTAVSS
jgi:hypothetical protein